MHFGLIFNPKPGITVRPPYPSKHAKIFFLLSNKILFVFMKYSLLLRGIFLHFKNYRNYTYFKSNQKSKVTNLFSFSKNVLLLLLLYFLFFQSINKRFIPKFQTSIFDTLLIIKNFFFWEKVDKRDLWEGVTQEYLRKKGNRKGKKEKEGGELAGFFLKRKGEEKKERGGRG